MAANPTLPEDIALDATGAAMLPGSSESKMLDAVMPFVHPFLRACEVARLCVCSHALSSSCSDDELWEGICEDWDAPTSKRKRGAESAKSYFTRVVQPRRHILLPGVASVFNAEYVCVVAGVTIMSHDIAKSPAGIPRDSAAGTVAGRRGSAAASATATGGPILRIHFAVKTDLSLGELQPPHTSHLIARFRTDTAPGQGSHAFPGVDGLPTIRKRPLGAELTAADEASMYSGDLIYSLDGIPVGAFIFFQYGQHGYKSAPLLHLSRDWLASHKADHLFRRTALEDRLPPVSGSDIDWYWGLSEQAMLFVRVAVWKMRPSSRVSHVAEQPQQAVCWGDALPGAAQESKHHQDLLLRRWCGY